MATIDIDPVLVERFANGNGTIFVGAGISTGSGMPGWGQLMEPLRRDVGVVDPCTHYFDIAELYETEWGRSELVNYLRKSLGDVRFQLTRAHELIVGLPVKRIYTTNFDDLLEQASARRQINRTVISNAAHVGFSDTSKLSIIKLHGDLNDPKFLVFTASDYYSYFTKNPAVADLLQVELQTHTILFLGYSFNDPNLGMILGKVASQSESNRPLLYSLQLSPSRLVTCSLRRRGVKVIPIDTRSGSPDASQKVEAWLRAFANALRRHERRKHYLRLTPFDVGDNIDIPKHELSPLRREALERIDNGLCSDFRVIVVKGEPGVGKTQLLALAASKCTECPGTGLSDEVFERVIWIRAECNASGVGHTLERIFRSILCSIQTTSAEIGKSASESHLPDTQLRPRQQEVNRLLQQHRALVVIEDLEHPEPTSVASASGKSRKLNAEVDVEQQHIDDKQQTQKEELKRIRDWLESPGPYAYPKSRIIVSSRSLILPGFVVEIEPLTRTQATTLIKEHCRKIMLRRAIDEELPEKSDDMAKVTIESLINITFRNPQVIKMALGLMNGTKDPEAPKKALAKLVARPDTKLETVFKALLVYALNWIENNLGPEPKTDKPGIHRTILVAMLAFPDGEPVPAHLLEIAAGKQEKPSEFTEHAQILANFGLLERNASAGTYTVHRIVRSLLKQRPEEAALVGLAHQRLAQHLLDHLRDKNVICRPDIKEEYWNALVRAEMSQVDPYWRIIKHVLQEMRNDPIITSFAMVLPHYMDSRLLNVERKAMLTSAVVQFDKLIKDPDNQDQIGALKRNQALLKIDALAWTHIEDRELDLAEIEIEEGLQLVRDQTDLVALAECWRTRSAMLRQKSCIRPNWDEAEKHMEQARTSIFSQSQRWIQLRIKMMDGDLHKLMGKPREALRLYREAEQQAEYYGGEGDGYQTSPRIGIALLDMKPEPTEEEEREAERRFEKLVENRQVAIGQLYGRYGLALLAARRNSTREAISQLNIIRQELYYRGLGNILLELTEALYEEINRRGHVST
jgi:hypothetical protein